MYQNFKGKTSAEKRDYCMTHYFKPLAEIILLLEPTIKSVLFTVAQYWNDEANDAVHEHIVLSNEENPQWPGDATYYEYYEDEDEDSLDKKKYNAIKKAETILCEQLGTSYLYFDSNDEMIVTFGSYCTENGYQDAEIGECYSPYAIARRGKNTDEVELEIVGQMHQPHWEDRFDFDENDEE